MCSVVCGQACWNWSAKAGIQDPARSRWHAEGDAAALRRTVFLDLFAGLMNQMGNRLGALQQQRSGGAQAHAAAVPGKQRNAKLVLQLPDLAAQRGLRQSQFLGRAADAAGARDAHEASELFQFHWLCERPRYAKPA